MDGGTIQLHCTIALSSTEGVYVWLKLASKKTLTHCYVASMVGDVGGAMTVGTVIGFMLLSLIRCTAVEVSS